MRKLSSIFKYVAPYWFTAFLSVILNLIAAVFSVVSFTMVIPFLGLLFSNQEFFNNSVKLSFTAQSVQHNFNYILGKIVNDKGQLNALLFIILVVLIFTLLKNIFLFIAKTLTIKIRTNVVKDVRNELLKKILDFDLSYFSNERRGDIISKMVVDVKEIELSIISSLEMIFKDPVLIIVYLWVLFFMSIKLTLIVLLIFPVSALIIGLIGRKLKHASRLGQQKMGALVSSIEEIIASIKIIKAFNAEEYSKRRFFKENQYYSQLFSKMWQKRNLANPVSDIISTISILLVMWYGGGMVLGSEPSLSSQVFIGFLAVFTQVIGPAKSFSNGYYTILKGIASVERVNTIFDHKFRITEKADAFIIQDFKDKIEFQKVNFMYDEKNTVLDQINLCFDKGKTIAIVGQSGSGKSTIVDLLPRFYDPSSGEILMDGINLKDVNINSLRNLFGYVNQEPVLFNDTIYQNILFGRTEATKNELELAAKLSFAHDFIIQKENSYETHLGVGGSKLSLGEKQRISIARALLKNPPILILDEATSALDYESELIVRKALENLMKDRTTIVIAHRLSTIKRADLIIVVDQGRVVEQGLHDELIALNGHYNKLIQLEYL